MNRGNDSWTEPISLFAAEDATLEEKKFISRQEHQTDTRAKVIKLTSEGAKILQNALTAVENADLDFFSGLGNSLSLFNQNMVSLIERNKDE